MVLEMTTEEMFMWVAGALTLCGPLFLAIVGGAA
jgi:hypothetical protein